MSLRLILASTLFVALLPVLALAQELRLVGDSPIAIDDPEAYRAYYGTLTGQPHVYTINSEDPFRLSLVVLTPNKDGARTDFSATIIDKAGINEPLVLDGALSEWRWFFDTAGRDEYLAGPILRGGLAAGEYDIQVTNPGDGGQYVLIVGEDGWFSVAGILSRYSTLPTIKEEFFGKPGYQAYLTPLLIWPVIALLTVLAVAVFALYIVRRRSQPSEVTV
jgi:hypothetical protein